MNRKPSLTFGESLTELLRMGLGLALALLMLLPLLIIKLADWITSRRIHRRGGLD